MSASLGLAGAYAGSRYSAVESFEIPEIGSTRSTTEQSNASKFLRGYYADFNVEWFANDRTGLFGGISAQKFDEYNQTVGAARPALTSAAPSASAAASRLSFRGSSPRRLVGQHVVDAAQPLRGKKRIYPGQHLLHQAVRAGGSAGDQHPLG